jgi:hypothetical protein
MIQKQDVDSVRRRLQDCLELRFEDVDVQIGEGIHYKGMNVVVTSRAFEGLLAEQRFHHLVRAIPQAFYEQYFQGGIVWFELVPGETGLDRMKMARAVDVAGQEADIRRRLTDVGFVAAFRERFAADPQQASVTRFDATHEVLIAAGLDADEIERCCLFMILQGAYCDAHVLTDVLPKLASEDAA